MSLKINHPTNVRMCVCGCMCICVFGSVLKTCFFVVYLFVLFFCIVFDKVRNYKGLKEESMFKLLCHYTRELFLTNVASFGSCQRESKGQIYNAHCQFHQFQQSGVTAVGSTLNTFRRPQAEEELSVRNVLRAPDLSWNPKF